MTAKWRKSHGGGKWEMMAVVSGELYRIKDVQGEFWILGGLGRVHYSKIDQVDHGNLLMGY